MKKFNLDNKILKVLLGIVFAISSSLLSFYLIVGQYYTTNNIIFTCSITAVVAFIIFIKTYKNTFNIIKKNKLFGCIAIIISLIILKEFYLSKNIVYFENTIWGFHIFRFRYLIFSVISLIYLSINILFYLAKILKEFIHSLNSWEKKAYLISTIIVLFLIVVFYGLNNNWFLQYDRVYSMDSGFMFNDILQSAVYYDIRHPLLNVITFPIYAIVNFILKLFVGTGTTLSIKLLGIIFQFINSQLLIITGLMLKKLTKEKIVFILYMLSFPTILFSLFFEKYQICTFFLVLYVYTICNKKEKSTPSIILAAGSILTSAYIGICELLVKDDFKNKIKKIVKIVCVTILCFICFGRGHLLANGLTEMLNMRNGFSNNNITILENIISTFKMIQSCLIALPSGIDTFTNAYLWTNLCSNFSIISIIIILIVIIGVIAKRKELFTKISFCWFIFAFILFVILKWASYESPLFALYFSWAIIPLFVAGLNYIIQKLKWNKKYVYCILMIIMILINVTTMFDIYNFISI